MPETLLEVRKLNKAFGMVVTAKDLDFSLQRGELTSVIGPNGAGKSTLINVLTGLLPQDSGEILFQGRDICNEPVHTRVRQGLCRSFQVVNVFSNLSLFENVAIPIFSLKKRAHRMLKAVTSDIEVGNGRGAGAGPCWASGSGANAGQSAVSRGSTPARSGDRSRFQTKSAIPG